MELYPNYIDSSTTTSLGEIKFFNKLKGIKSSKNILFHSLDVRDHISNFMGEIDFLMIVPEKGILTIEIKSHKRIEFNKETGFWKLGNDNPERRGPFKQARDNRISLREKLIGNYPVLKGILFWDLVIFSEVKIENQYEWNKWEYMDSRDFQLNDIDFLKKIESTLEIAFEKNKEKLPINHAEPNDNHLGILRNLRKNIEVYLSPRERIESQEKQLHKVFTDNQFKYLDATSSNNRILIEGPAGTGKTLLAIETSRRITMDNKKVLFICFNSLLQKYLEEQLKNLKDLDVITYSSLIQKISKKTLGEIDQDEVLLRALEIKEEKKFDALIIDEAQDILDNDSYDILDNVFKNGFKGGVSYIFGDFEHQKIQNVKSQFDIFDFKDKSGFFLIKLQENCRNLPDVLQVAKFFCKSYPYTKVCRPDENSEPITKTYEDEEDQLGNLASIILELDKEFLRDEITILTTKTIENSIFKYNEVFPIFHLLNDNPKKYRPINYTGKFNFDRNRFNFNKKINFTTIRKYKGLENNVIILTDVDNLDDELQRNILHTGITRTKQKIIVSYKKGISFG